MNYYCYIVSLLPLSSSLSVGEEDEVSIRDVALMIAEAMNFKGEVVVS